MNIKCRKMDCTFNDKTTCKAKDILITSGIECNTYQTDNTKETIMPSRMLFEVAPEFENSRHIKDANLKCNCESCLFNKDKNCNANGITVLDEGETKTCCGTFIKDF